MNKNLQKKLISSVLILLILVSLLSACYSKETKYKIDFMADNNLVQSITTSGNEKIVLPQAPDKDSYKFIGWYLDEGTWQKKVDENYFIDNPLTSDIKLYAYYEYIKPVVQKYKITFYADDVVVDTVLSAGNEQISLPVAPDKENYEFKGWYLDNNVWSQIFDGKNYIDKPLTSDINVYAHYLYKEPVPEKYTVSFYADGNLIDSVKSAGNEYIPMPKAPDKQNYEFKGWYLDEGTWQKLFDGYNYIDSELTDNIKIYAYYEYIMPEYTITFNTNQGSSVGSVKVSVLESSPLTVRDGYEFVGWYEDSNFTKKVYFPYYPSKDITLYAKWEEKNVEFVFNSDKEISGIKGVPKDGNLYIPASVNGVKVEGIAAEAFQDNKDIVNVVVDDSITYIGANCFRRCTNLKSAKVSNKMKSLPSGLFDGCSSLSSFEFPEALEEIRYDVFSGTGFEEIVLPDSVISIWNYAFKDCKNLKKIDLAKVEDLGEGVFQNCTQLSGIVIPDSIVTIDGQNMFSGCTSLTDIVLPSKSVSFKHTLLYDTAYYNNPDNWENGVLYLDKYLICINKDFINTQSYTVKDGTIAIAEYAFSDSDYAQKLSNVTLPESLKVIGSKAFYDCSSLSKVNIPQSVEKIGVSAFDGTLLVSSDKTSYVDGWLLKYVGAGEKTISLPEGTVGIADGQIFRFIQDNIERVELPSTFKYIGDENFMYMANLQQIVLPSSLKRIGLNAFYSCPNLQAIDLSQCKELEKIEGNAFFYCKSVKRFVIPKSVKVLGESVFNQIPFVVVDIEITQDQIPEGWSKKWDFTYASTPVTVNWGVKI